MKAAWTEGKVCDRCSLPVEYDLDSGYWIHSGYEKVDGHNGLFCESGMWDGTVTRHYATGVNPPRVVHAPDTRENLIRVLRDPDITLGAGIRDEIADLLERRQAEFVDLAAKEPCVCVGHPRGIWSMCRRCS